MKKQIILILAFLLLTGNSANSQIRSDISNLKKHLNFLASDNMKGRLPGSKEDTLCEKYISAELSKEGYKPYFNSSTLPFEFIKSRIASESSSIMLNGTELRYGKDYVIPPFSGNCNLSANIQTAGNFENPVAFKSGSAVIVKSNSDEIKLKVTALADKGATIVFFYNPDDKQFNFSEGELSAQLSIPVVYLSPDIASKIISEKESSVSAKINMIVSKTKSANIVMSLNSRNAIGTIVIGAHFDHLGMGEYGSRTPNRREVHNGADDNASGVASIIEIGRLFSKNRKNLKYNIIIAAFGAEEKGLLGSKAFSDSLKKVSKLPSIMFNLDMVGRLVDNKLQVGGTGTFTGADSLVNKINEIAGFKLSVTKGGTGASDHSSFYSTGVPVLYFTTGVHQQYHTPDDDIDLINFEGMAKVCDFVYDISSEVAKGSFKPFFTKVAASEDEPVRTSFKVSLGVVPDFTYEAGDGFRIGAVSDGKPASKAGLLSGDIITSMNGKGVKNIYEYMARLGELKSGDLVDVIIKRDDKILNYKIQL